VLEAIDLDTVESKGYGFQVELTYRTHRRGFSIREIPIIFREREQGRSKLGLSMAWEAAVKVWKMKFENSTEESRFHV
jgi:dolichol-phosphate mannosyltransferase